MTDAVTAHPGIPTPPTPFAISQIAIVVRDIEKAMRDYTHTLGWGPWSVFDYKPPLLHDTYVRGEPVEFRMIGAETSVNGLGFELIQPVSGPSIYQEHLDQHGEGVQHIACMKHSVEDSDLLKQHLTEHGSNVVMGGKIGESIEFYYIDTSPTLKFVLESGSGHAIDLVPTYTYPGLTGRFIRMRVLVVGDPYMPVTAFTGALGALDPPPQLTTMQIERTDAEPARTESEGRLREYAGDPAAVVAALPGHDVLVVHGAPVTAEALAVPGLRMVCCARGGPVNVDVDAATAAGIPVVNSPGKNARAVAELTLAFTLLLLRRVPRATDRLRSGPALGTSAFEGREFFGREAAGSTIGLIGLGQVGRQVADLAARLGMTVLGYDPIGPADPPIAAHLTGLEELLHRSDVVSIHARATATNHHLFDHHRIAQMRPGSALINTARESLVDEPALLAALRAGHLSGAGLDVFEVPADGRRNPLLDDPNVLITPHIGGATDQTLARGAAMVAEAVQALMAGRPLPYLVNPQVDPYARQEVRP